MFAGSNGRTEKRVHGRTSWYIVGVPSSDVLGERSNCGVLDPPVSCFPLGPSQPYLGLPLLFFVARISGFPALSQQDTPGWGGDGAEMSACLFSEMPLIYLQNHSGKALRVLKT